MDATAESIIAARPTDSTAPVSKPGLTPPQFRLSTMLAVTAVVCLALALAKVIHPMLSGVIALFLIVAFAHVAGNALGTQLKHSSRHAEPLDHRHVPAPDPTDKHEGGRTIDR